MTAIFAVIICIILLLSSRISRPLEDAAAVMGKVAEELDLAKRLDVKSQDEVGRMAGSFNYLMEVFSKAIKQVIQTASEVSNSSQKVGAVSSQVVKNASAQAERAQDVLKRVETMGNTAREVASRAESSKEATLKASKGVQEISSGARRGL